MWPCDVGLALEQRFGILTRVGLHCAPAAHRALGTFPTGTVRLSVGWFTTREDVDYTAEAVAALAAEAR
jgi:selenocysteine lyase/cysteine desulfurase